MNFAAPTSLSFCFYDYNAAENCQTAVRGLTTSHTRSPAEKYSRFGSEWVPPLSRSRDLPNFSKICKTWCTASKKELILGVQSSGDRGMGSAMPHMMPSSALPKSALFFMLYNMFYRFWRNSAGPGTWTVAEPIMSAIRHLRRQSNARGTR